LNISETVRDRGLVPKDHQWEMAYEESNGPYLLTVRVRFVGGKWLGGVSPNSKVGGV